MNKIAELPTKDFQPGSRFKTLLWREIDFDAEAAQGYLIKHLLDAGAMSVVYGESGCGKSFFTTDLALHVALGWEWRDRRVRRAGALYIAAEGGRGMLKRITSFRQHHGIELDANVPFALVPTAVNLLDPSVDVEDLIKEVMRIGRTLSHKVELIVVDTLSRALAGGNENGPEDMGAFVKNVGRLQEETGAHVLVVHHSGKDAARGARGHNLLRAATDTEIEIAKGDEHGPSVATVKKQREEADGQQIAFRLQRIELGLDSDGDAVSSCVVCPVEGEHEARRAARVTGASKVALDLLKRAISEAGERPPASHQIPDKAVAVKVSLWRGYCERGQITDGDSPDALRKAFQRSATKLQELGLIGVFNEWVWLAG